MRSLLAPSRGSQSSSDAESESREGNIRVVEKADLAGIGLVASPSFPASRVETRAAGTLTASIPYESLRWHASATGGVSPERLEKG